MVHVRNLIDRVSRVRFEIWSAIALFLMAAGYLGPIALENHQAKPPSPHCTIAELAAKVPPPFHLAVVEQGGSRGVVWVGPISWKTVRSGPPCYLFDSQGRLLDWCAETGEGWTFDQVTSLSLENQNISLDSVRKP